MIPNFDLDCAASGHPRAGSAEHGASCKEKGSSRCNHGVQAAGSPIRQQPQLVSLKLSFKQVLPGAQPVFLSGQRTAAETSPDAPARPPALLLRRFTPPGHYLLLPPCYRARLFPPLSFAALCPPCFSVASSGFSWLI